MIASTCTLFQAADADAADAAGEFVLRHAQPMRTVLVPEIALYLATEPFAIFHSAEVIGADRPYWAFAWSGGQALARWLIDNPGEIAGRTVLDVGAGSGLTAIAALQAGAAVAIANDTDPLACAAARLNAVANRVPLGVTQDDLLDTVPEADIILIGDLFYEAALMIRVTRFLDRCRRRGIPVLFADRATSRQPSLPLLQIASYAAPLTPDMETAYVEQARVWRLA